LIVDNAGLGALTHLGIDTVTLAGSGFDLLVAARRGQPVIGWDPDAVAARGLSVVCPVVAISGESAGRPAAVRLRHTALLDAADYDGGTVTGADVATSLSLSRSYKLLARARAERDGT